ncbi:MAG TPA: hypothetical protein VM686_29405 [Polyangiaceae bacterium]|nr:hypothetical protein [Polyangiaceae bacterium]
MEAARFHLPEVGEQGGEEVVRTSDETARGGDEVSVGERGR